MWKDWLDYFGIVPASAVAGFAGGVVNILWFKNLSPFDVLSSTVAGTFMAIYLGKFMSDLTHLPIEVICFLMGAGGMPIMGQLISLLRQRMGGNNNARS